VTVTDNIVIASITRFLNRVFNFLQCRR